MKNSIVLFGSIAAATILLTGCNSTASEQEKEAFSRNVMRQDNLQEQEQFDEAIEPGYQAEGVGQTPSWEMPAN